VRRLLPALLAAALLGAAPAADDTAELVDVVNRHRAGVGCAPLRWHEGAARAAQAHAEDMRRRGYFDHLTPEGLRPRDRLRAAGVQVRGVTAENLVDAPFGGERLLGRWLASPAHRENIDDCGFTHHGIGRAGDLWVHLFLTVRS
jgi:uncharacterized protein YkwD